MAKTLLEWIKRIELYTGVLIMTALIVMLLDEIVARGFFRKSFVWTIDLTKTLYVWLVFCGASVLLKENRHLKIQIFVNMISSSRLIIVKTFVNLIILLSLIIIVISGIIQYKVQQNITLPSILLSRKIISMPVIIFGISMVLTITFDLIDNLKGILKLFKQQDHN
jgi:TRAP-type C4-dicarboxylate transport system permease small subunit